MPWFLDWANFMSLSRQGGCDKRDHLMKLFYSLAVSLLLPFAAFAQVAFTGTTISQDFNSMLPTGTTVPNGWFVGAFIGGNGAINDTTVAVDDGSFVAGS